MKNKNATILILGATGMLGNALLKYLSSNKDFKIFGTARDWEKVITLPKSLQANIFRISLGIESLAVLEDLLLKIKPDIVINCIGVIKQSPLSEKRKIAVEINALLPHLIAETLTRHHIKLIHISTDCVFSGNKGGYREFDDSDAIDVYGKTKFLGEIGYDNHLTIRTSIIGHEIDSSISLLDWFLVQKDQVNGYLRAIYSGVTTLELAKIIEKYFITINNFQGLFHVSSEPISKFDLLSIVNNVYKKNIKIIPQNQFVIDRSLDSKFFQKMTGHRPKSWDEQIEELYQFNLSNVINQEKDV